MIPLTLTASALAYAALLGYTGHLGVRVDVGGQESPQQIFFGTDVRLDDPSRFLVPIVAVAGVFYALISLVFVGLGRPMGRRFNAIPDRVLAYTADIGGSLAGIAAFGLTSWLRLPPWVWFAIGLAPVLGFARRCRPLQGVCLLALMGLAAYSDYAGVSDLDPSGRDEVTWSPYYKVQFNPWKRIVLVNNMPHQQMVRVGASGAAYMLPHLLHRDARAAGAYCRGGQLHERLRAEPLPASVESDEARSSRSPGWRRARDSRRRSSSRPSSDEKPA